MQPVRLKATTTKWANWRPKAGRPPVCGSLSGEPKVRRHAGRGNWRVSLVVVCTSAARCVGRARQFHRRFKEGPGLAHEQTVFREGFDGRDRAAVLVQRGADDRARRQPFSFEEVAWLGKNQVSLKLLSTEWRRVQIRERDTGFGITL